MTARVYRRAGSSRSVDVCRAACLGRAVASSLPPSVAERLPGFPCIPCGEGPTTAGRKSSRGRCPTLATSSRRLRFRQPARCRRERYLSAAAEGRNMMVASNGACPGSYPDAVSVPSARGGAPAKTHDVLTADAIEFRNLLAREFGGEREELLAQRHARAQSLRDGELPDFLAQTQGVRDGDWSVAPAPAGGGLSRGGPGTSRGRQRTRRCRRPRSCALQRGSRCSLQPE